MTTCGPTQSAGLLARGEYGLRPCTPSGVIEGASRKSFLGAILTESGEPGPSPRASTVPPAGRDAATAAVSALAAAAGAWCVRVHDVRGSLDAVRVAAAWNAPSGWEKGGNHAICGAVPGGVPGP